jgi:pimeloyl-ACP methyl ester carboxylesterase
VDSKPNTSFQSLRAVYHDFQMKILCFSGWSAQRPLFQWNGLPAVTIPHDEQWRVLADSNAPIPQEWLPEENWVMVTWSMGTWAGLKLSSFWEKNPPKAWIALSPFLRLAGGTESKIKSEALEVLLRSFRSKPKETLDFFCRQQGGKEPWCKQEDLLGREELIGDSLEALLSMAPCLPKEKIDIPIYTFLGDKDRLVSEEMVKEFENYGSNVTNTILSSRGHGIFYEDQPDCKFIFADLSLSF